MTIEEVNVGGRRQDRATRWLLVSSVAIAAVSLIVAAAALPTLVDTRTSVEEQRRASAVTACRGEIRAELDLATATVDDLILDGLHAAMIGDKAAINDVVFRSIPARAEREAAVEAVRAAAKFATDDPDAFLESCRTPGS